jgi:hypothetical protein
MNSAAKAFGEDVRNLAAIDSETRVSYHVFERPIFRYGLAVLSVALALGIKLLLLRLNFPYPLSTSFLAAIAITLVCGNRTRHSCFLVLFIPGVRLFLSRIKLTIVWFFRTERPSPSICRPLAFRISFYLVYFGLVAL